VTPVLLLLNAMVGLLAGAQFPLANRMLLHRRPEFGARARLLHAMDLLGAFASSLVVSAALLPGLGMVQTCPQVAGLKAGSLVLAASMSRGAGPARGKA